MKNILMNIWRKEEGAETAEWIVIVALILAVALVVYDDILLTTLTGVVTAIGTAVTGII
jgi:Flp pilus assembly pilin Flp